MMVSSSGKHAGGSTLKNAKGEKKPPSHRETPTQTPTNTELYNCSTTNTQFHYCVSINTIQINQVSHLPK